MPKTSSTCETCGKAFEYYACSQKGRFCSGKCNRTNWKGGIQNRKWSVDKDGYLYMTDVNHPMSSPSGILRKHWYVMYEKSVDKEAMIRLRKSGATIHHKDGVRNSNGKDNLEVRLKGNHPKGVSEEDMIDLLRSRGYVVEAWTK